MLDKTTLGTRYTCYECGTKFYDLNRPEPLCPDCGADQTDAPTRDIRSLLGKGKRASARDSEKKKSAPAPAADPAKPLDDADGTGAEESGEGEEGADSDGDDSLGLLGLDKAT